MPEAEWIAVGQGWILLHQRILGRIYKPDERHPDYEVLMEGDAKWLCMRHVDLADARKQVETELTARGARFVIKGRPISDDE